MGVSAQIQELYKVDTVIAPSDITTAKTGAWLPVAHYRRFLAFLSTDTVAQTKAATLQLYQAQDASGTGAKALGGAVTVTAPTGGAKLDVQVEGRQDQLDEGFAYVTAHAVSDNASAVSAAAILIRGEGRYGVAMP